MNQSIQSNTHRADNAVAISPSARPFFSFGQTPVRFSLPSLENSKLGQDSFQRQAVTSVSEKPLGATPLTVNPIQSLQTRDLFFSQQSVRSRVEKFITDQLDALRQADIEAAKETAGTEIKTPVPSTMTDSLGFLFSSSDWLDSPASAITFRVMAPAVDTENVAENSDDAPVASESKPESGSEPLPLIYHVQSELLTVIPQPNLPAHVGITAAADHRLSATDAPAFRSIRYAWDPARQEVYPEDIFTQKNIQPLQHEARAAVLQSLRTAAQQMATWPLVGDWLKALHGMVSGIVSIDDQSVLRIGNRWKFDWANYYQDGDGNRLQLFDVIRLPSGGLGLVQDRQPLQKIPFSLETPDSKMTDTKETGKTPPANTDNPFKLATPAVKLSFSGKPGKPFSLRFAKTAEQADTQPLAPIVPPGVKRQLKDAILAQLESYEQSGHVLQV